MAALEKPEVGPIPGQLTVDEVKGNSVPRTDEQSSSLIAEVEAEKDKPLVFTSVTPSGITVGYSPAPRRYYTVNGEECPSVTSVLGVLEKGGLSYWGNKIGVDAVLELVRRGLLRWVAE